jgi:hypothetical protein
MMDTLLWVIGFMIIGTIGFIGGWLTAIGRFPFSWGLGFPLGFFLGTLIIGLLKGRVLNVDVGWTFLWLLSYVVGIEVRRRVLEKARRRHSR